MVKKITIIILLFSHTIIMCKDVNKQEIYIKKTIDKFVGTIIKKDINSMLELFPEEDIEIDADTYVDKNIIREDLAKKGIIYNSLFDTNKHKEYIKKTIMIESWDGRRDYYLCLRDVFKQNYNKIRIDNIRYLIEHENIIVVDLSWKGKNDKNSESKNIRYYIQLNKLKNKWLITSLNFRMLL